MAEIKSTMDLVMERTRHLSMSEEEKKEKQQEEAVGRIRGILQKLQDKAVKLSEAEREIEAIKKDYDRNGIRTDPILKAELIERLDLEQENTALLRLLETRFGIETDPLHDLIEQYHNSLDTARQDRLNELRRRLSATHLISGAAVIPNPSADPDWRRMVADIKSSYARRLREEIEKAG